MDITIPDAETAYHTPYTVDLWNMTELEQIGAYMDRVENLPKSMLHVMTDQSTARVINEQIGPQFKLSPDQIKDLTRIVRDVLLSSLYVGNLVQEIGKRLGVNEAIAKQIATALVEQVFKSAMDDIKALQVATFKDRIQQKTPQQEGNVINLRDRTSKSTN